MTNDRIDQVSFPERGAPPPSEALLDALEPMLGASDRELAYAAAARLCAWGRDTGARWFIEQFDALSGELPSHRLWGYADYDVIAQFAFMYGCSGGRPDLEAEIYRRLLRIARMGQQEFGQHLPVALELSATTLDIVEDLYGVLEQAIEQDGSVGITLLGALAGVDPDRASALIGRKMAKGSLDSSDIDALAAAIAEMRTSGAWQWANRLSESSDATERMVGMSALHEISGRVEHDAYQRWSERWKEPNRMATRYLGLAPLGHDVTKSLRDAFWGTGDQLERNRRLLSLRTPEPSARWDATLVRAALHSSASVGIGSVDELLLAAMGVSTGDADAVVRLHAWVDRRLATKRATLPAIELELDEAGEIVVEALYHFGRQSGDWSAFEAIARRMLKFASVLGVGVVFGRALLDAARQGLLDDLTKTHDELVADGRAASASLLLPALASLDPDRAWPRVERATRVEPTFPLDERIFAVAALLHLGSRGRELAKGFVKDSNPWVSIFAEDVDAQVCG